MPDAGQNRAPSVSERVYRALLLAYPKGFRSKYGAQMAQVFRDMWREELERGGKVGLARLWVRTVVDLAATAFVERNGGRSRTDDKEVAVNDHKLAGVGFVLLLAPLYFVSASLLKYGLGIGLLFDPLEAFLSVSQRREVFDLVSPAVFLGGLGLAMALNAYAVLRPSFGRENGAILCTIRLEMKSFNVAVVVAGSLVLVTLVGYVFLENFTQR